MKNDLQELLLQAHLLELMILAYAKQVLTEEEFGALLKTKSIQINNWLKEIVKKCRESDI